MYIAGVPRNAVYHRLPRTAFRRGTVASPVIKVGASRVSGLLYPSMAEPLLSSFCGLNIKRQCQRQQMCQVASFSFSFLFSLSLSVCVLCLSLLTYAIYRAFSIQTIPTYTSIPVSSSPPSPSPSPSPYPSHLYRLNSLLRSWSEKSPRPSRFRLRHSLGLLLRPLGAAEGGSRRAHGHISGCCGLVQTTVLD